MDSMKQWNELAGEMNNFITRNYEMATKFWKTVLEQNQNLMARNIEAYFAHMNQNIVLLNNLWENFVKNREDLRNIYTENMKELFTNFQTLYNETVRPFVQGNEKARTRTNNA